MDIDDIIDYLFEMWTTEQGAKLTAEEVAILMKHLQVADDSKYTK